MGFAYCDFHNQGAHQMLMARAVARPRYRRIEPAASAEAPRTEVSARVETPRVDSARIDPVKTEAKAEPPKAAEPARTDTPPELRRSTE
jgi:hypothetical protein